MMILSSDLRLSVWMFAEGRMVLRVFLGSHGTLVAVSAPLMMPLRDSDIPMNVPFTFSNTQPLPLYCRTYYKAVRVGGGGEWRTCAMRDYDPRPVWMSLLITLAPLRNPIL
jgi:hypothetical protein